MSTSEPRTFSRACLALASLAGARRTALLAGMIPEARASVQEELLRFDALGPDRRELLLASLQQKKEASPESPAPETAAPVREPETLVRILEHEHPVLLALVLEGLDPREAARTFTLLSPQLRKEVASQIAGGYRPAAWVADRLEAWLSRATQEAPDLVPGRLTRILARCPAHVAEDVLDALGAEAKHPDGVVLRLPTPAPEGVEEVA